MAHDLSAFRRERVGRDTTRGTRAHTRHTSHVRVADRAPVQIDDRPTLSRPFTHRPNKSEGERERKREGQSERERERGREGERERENERERE